MLSEGQQLSHYRLVRLLKSGGMGEVYLAVDTLLHRQVAIKVIQTDTLRYAEIDAAKQAARLFLREAQAIAQLDQANILPLYASGQQNVNGTALMYMVMPYRQAGSLADWKRTHFGEQVLPLAAVERIVNQAALALQHAHDRQIIHQDVKPSNFLVHGEAEYPAKLHLQLADFGVAKFMLMTADSQVIRGTPTYMAPEQWDGHPVPATDQYALAVMTYELLTGCPPFIGNSFHQLWYQHSHTQPGPASLINPILPWELDAVMLRALEKNPVRRYNSVSDFAYAFQRAVLNSGDVHQTLTITRQEARTGTTRLIPIPGEKPVMVTVPSGVNHGQIIRLEGMGRPTTYNNPVGALIVTILLAPIVTDAAFSPMIATYQHPNPISTPPDKNTVRSTLLPIALKKRRNKDRLLLAIAFAFAFVLLVGMIGLIGLYVVTKPGTPVTIHKNHGNTTATATPNLATTYPSYLPGIGIVALNEPLKDDSKGNNWASAPTPFGSCFFKDNVLHVKVYGNMRVTFHACVPESPSTSANPLSFNNFAYQVTMSFVTGDCGGITFRGLRESFYYFFICRNRNYQCHNDSTKVCNYGLIRYTKDPASGVPDFNLNPLLTEGFSQHIMDGANKPYTVAVVAQSSHFDLYVNGQPIDQFTDITYTQGNIGVLAKTFGPYLTEVVFSDAKVWRL